MRLRFLLAVAGVCLTMSGCASLTPPDNPENDFLNFIPDHEQGAPHDMKYIIEQQTGNLGYYKTDSIPGDITVSNASKGSHNIEWKISGMDIKFNLTKDAGNLRAINNDAILIFDTIGSNK